MKYILLLVKGFFIGIANIIPGVSGGTIAIILGIYEQLISTISHFFSNLKENLLFVIPIGIGLLVSIGVMSGVIEYSYDNFPVPTMMFFVGLVLGGIPMLMKNVINKKESKSPINFVIFLLTFCLVIFMSLSGLIFGTSLVDLSNLNFAGYLLLFCIGVVAAATMVIPGISGSLVLMLLGYYYPIVSIVHELVKFKNIPNNILILGVFGLGVVFGIVFISKLLEMLFKNYKVKTYFGVLGFIFASIIAIPVSTILEHVSLDISLATGIISIIMLVVGSIVSYKLGDK